MRPATVIVLLFFLSSVPRVSAEVLRMPPISVPFVFPTEPQFLPDATVWADYRLYNDFASPDDFGTDFELGSAFSVVGTERFAIRFIPRLLYQARQYQETNNPLDFSPRHITTDLRVSGAYRFDALIAYGGARHDCTHLVDMAVGRKPIHDAFFAGVQDEWRLASFDSGRTLRSRVFAEGEYNIPSLFWDEATFIDRARFTVGSDTDISDLDVGTPFINGYLSYIYRTPERTVTDGIQRHNVDWGVAVGYRIHGSAGDLSLYYRVERITDAWNDRDVRPVILYSFGGVLRI